jgi:hypothetical protein
VAEEALCLAGSGESPRAIARKTDEGKFVGTEGARLGRGRAYSAMDISANFGYSAARISIVAWAMTALRRA